MRTFNKKWKRRKDYTRFWYKLGIFIALYLRMYKYTFTKDGVWSFKTYTFLLQNKHDCIIMYFNNKTLSECKVIFKNVLLEEFNREKGFKDNSLFISELLKDCISDCQGFDDLIKGIHYIGCTKKIIEELQKLEK